MPPLGPGDPGASPQELALDARHSLLLVGQVPPQWAPADPDQALLLFFRSPAEEGNRGGEVRLGDPGLVLESGRERVGAELVEAAGWGISGGPAVALYRLPTAGLGGRPESGPGPRLRVQLGDQELSGAVPVAWLAGPGGG
ncbi:MAG: hypothetical protein ACREOD_01430 [Candidatus Dormibacteria bacterium]